MTGHHFSNELNIYITGLIALLGGIGVGVLGVGLLQGTHLPAFNLLL